MLHGDDGSTVPYEVRFAGAVVDLSHGEANVAEVRLDGPSHDGDDVQIVTRHIPLKPGTRYRGHLVLVVKPRWLHASACL